MDAHELRHRFTFHPATGVTKPQHDQVRGLCERMAYELNSLLPEGRHKSLAMTALQEAMMWSSAAIACDTEE